MIVLFPLLLVLAAALLIQHRSEPAAERRWAWFSAWTFAGGLFTFSLLAGFSIGLFFLPAAGLALFLVARQSPHRVEAIGFAEGIGMVVLIVAYINRHYRPCTPGSVLIGPDAPVGTSFSCGGFDPKPWWVAGTALCVGALSAYVSLRRSARRAS